MKKEERLILDHPKIYNPPREKVEKRFPKWIKPAFFGVLLLALIIYLIFFSPLFKIRSIEIKGALPAEGINYLNQFKGQNLFMIKSQVIATKLQADYPEYLSVEIYKGIPNVLRVQIDQRGAKFVWKTQGHYFLVDDEGLAYKEVSDQEISNLILVVDKKDLPLKSPTMIATANFTNFLENAKMKLKEAGFDIATVEINETIFQVDVITSKGFKIIFDTTRTLTDQMDAFNYVYKDHKDEIKQYVDTRVEGKVYYQ